MRPACIPRSHNAGIVPRYQCRTLCDLNSLLAHHAPLPFQIPCRPIQLLRGFGVFSNCRRANQRSRNQNCGNGHVADNRRLLSPIELTSTVDHMSETTAYRNIVFRHFPGSIANAQPSAKRTGAYDFMVPGAAVAAPDLTTLYSRFSDSGIQVHTCPQHRAWDDPHTVPWPCHKSCKQDHGDRKAGLN